MIGLEATGDAGIGQEIKELGFVTKGNTIPAIQCPDALHAFVAVPSFGRHSNLADQRCAPEGKARDVVVEHTGEG